jgi:uncharacterized membrane protein YoaK (UPF0700 family)
MVEFPFPPAVFPALALLLVTWVAMVYAVSVDAHTRNVPPGIAAVLGVTAAVLPMGLLAYYVACDRLGPRRSPPTTRERAAWTLVLAMTVAFVLGATLSPPDPFTQLFELPAFLLVALPAAYLVVFRDAWTRVKSVVR